MFKHLRKSNLDPPKIEAQTSPMVSKSKVVFRTALGGKPSSYGLKPQIGGFRAHFFATVVKTTERGLKPWIRGSSCKLGDQVTEWGFKGSNCGLELAIVSSSLQFGDQRLNLGDHTADRLSLKFSVQKFRALSTIWGLDSRLRAQFQKSGA